MCLVVSCLYESTNIFSLNELQSGKIDHNTPVILWLQGGPGASSLFGLFVENGPLQVTKDLQIFQRNHTWNKDFAILYFDQPVGTSFSFTDNDEGKRRKWYSSTEHFALLLQVMPEMRRTSRVTCTRR